MNGFGTSVAVEIHTFFTCRYSRIISCPLWRPMPVGADIPVHTCAVFHDGLLSRTWLSSFSALTQL
jgi:hypothetical protein